LISGLNLSTYGQREASKWLFGKNLMLSFQEDTTLLSYDNSIYHEWGLESSGSVTDNIGNLLFYTNGNIVWNKNHEIMQGGTDLDGSWNASQNGLILNHPDNDSLYYVFLTPYSYDYMNGLKYCIVNIKANNGNGKVVEKNVLLHPNSSEKVSAIYHANGKDIWIVGHEWGNNNFCLYLLTSNGFSKCPVINSVGIEYKRHSIFTDGIFMNQGFLKFSQNSKYMVHVFTPDPLDLHSELYEFDNLSGKLSYYMKVNTVYYPHGTEFTHDSKYLLIARSFSNERLLKINIENKTITEEDTLNEGALLQISNTKKILIGYVDSSFIDMFSYSEDNFQIYKKYISINKDSGRYYYGFPNIFIGYLTHGQPRIQYQSKCSAQTFDFKVSFADNINKWIFTHQNLSKEIEKMEISPRIIFVDTGLWLVRCVLSNNDTVTTNIFIEPAIDPHFLGKDTGWCEHIGSSMKLQAPNGMHCYEWSNGSTFSSTIADTTGTYWAKIVTPNFCVHYDIINLTIDTVPNTPTIYRDNDTLKTDAIADRYLWLKDGNTIGINSPSLVLSDTGIYHLQVMSNGGCTAFSDTIHITAEEDTLTDNVTKVSFLESIAIYPNPAEDLLHIELKEQTVYEIVIADITGKVIYNHRAHLNGLHTVDTRIFNSGVYLVKLKSVSGIYVVRVVKQ
jgi:hypothetical protein